MVIISDFILSVSFFQCDVVACTEVSKKHAAFVFPHACSSETSELAWNTTPFQNLEDKYEQYHFYRPDSLRVEMCKT
jgi:hypothetical protein